MLGNESVINHMPKNLETSLDESQRGEVLPTLVRSVSSVTDYKAVKTLSRRDLLFSAFSRFNVNQKQWPLRSTGQL